MDAAHAHRHRGLRPGAVDVGTQDRFVKTIDSYMRHGRAVFHGLF
jgi:hypothetical protein